MTTRVRVGVCVLALGPLSMGGAEATAAGPRKPIIAYFTEWGIFARQYTVRSLKDSGSAARITHVNYAFAKVGPDLTCTLADPHADYRKPFGAEDSVDGVADTTEGVALRGNFNQLRKLKILYPDVKVMISVGGWLWSDRFSDASASPELRRAFVKSCVDLFIKGDFAPGIQAPGIFDGIDIDWEFPAGCGNVCAFRPEDTQNFTALLAELRAQLDAAGASDGKRYLSSIATPAGAQNYSKIELANVASLVDFVNLMAYDQHVVDEKVANVHSALYGNEPDPSYKDRLWVDAAVTAYLKAGVPSSKLILGVPFYGHGWEGVAPGPHGDGLYQPATGPAPATWGTGTEDYKVLAAQAVPRHFDERMGALWTYDPDKRVFWAYDDAAVLRLKTDYIKKKKLGGAMLWEVSGDDAKGTLMSALRQGLGD
jgi:chitinase